MKQHTPDEEIQLQQQAEAQRAAARRSASEHKEAPANPYAAVFAAIETAPVPQMPARLLASTATRIQAQQHRIQAQNTHTAAAVLIGLAVACIALWATQSSTHLNPAVVPNTPWGLIIAAITAVVVGVVWIARENANSN